jgi:hypothetical protein
MDLEKGNAEGVAGERELCDKDTAGVAEARGFLASKRKLEVAWPVPQG